jgi:PucR-like helix-turn-helix protein/diguanylate cyclase with GGDEF domain
VSAWDVTPPPGWEPVAEVCRVLYLDRAAVTSHLNSRIQREVSEFEPGESVISSSDLRWSTGRGVENFLRGVAECRPPAEDELAFQRLVGERSAIRGLPLEPLISSFQVGFRELWSTLTGLAMRSETAAARLLLERGSIVWERLVATTSALAEGYNAELERREAFETAATSHFIEALAQEPDSEEAHALATEIGFAPDGGFRVIEVGGPVGMGDVARAIATKLQASGAIASAAQHGRVAVVIAQGAGCAALEEALAGAATGSAIGVGVEASGLEGARSSMLEAERALAVAIARRHTIWFERDWLIAVAWSQHDVVERLLAPGLRAAVEKPHLAAALRAFADAGFSVAEAARALRVSANSMRYRLSRWRELTGWDPWAFDGMARSMIALDFALAPLRDTRT